jgi:hypothetical protein
MNFSYPRQWSEVSSQWPMVKICKANFSKNRTLDLSLELFCFNSLRQQASFGN